MFGKTKNGKFDEDLVTIIDYLDVRCHLYDTVFHTMIHPRNIINNAMKSYQITREESKLYIDEKNLSGNIMLVTPVNSFCHNAIFFKKEGKMSYNLKSKDITDFIVMLISQESPSNKFMIQDVECELDQNTILTSILLELRSKSCKRANAEIETLGGEIIKIKIEIDENKKVYSRRKI